MPIGRMPIAGPVHWSWSSANNRRTLKYDSDNLVIIDLSPNKEKKKRRRKNAGSPLELHLQLAESTGVFRMNLMIRSMLIVMNVMLAIVIIIMTQILNMSTSSPLELRLQSAESTGVC